MADFFDANIEDDKEDFGYYVRSLPRELAFGNVANKDAIIFLVDASTAMRKKADIKEVEGFEETDTGLEAAVKVVLELLKQHVVGSPRDKMAVVFYGAKQVKNESSFASVHVYQELTETTASRIKEVEALLGEGFAEQIGSAESASGDDLRDGLWAASQLFTADKGRADRKVIIFTNTADPSAGDSLTREQIVSRAKQLHEAKVEVQLFDMSPEETRISTDAFFKDVLKAFDDELVGETAPTAPLRAQDLDQNRRQRIYKKRPLGSLMLNLGPDIAIAVKLYALIQKALPSKSVSIDLRTNEALQSDGAYICNDTGAVLERIEKYMFPKQGTAPRFPPVILSAQQRQAIKALKPPGIELLGFKSLARLQPYHQLRTSTFVYPDEVRCKGSATVFIAFHDRMLKSGVFALASAVRSTTAEPRLVALVAQEEEVDEFGAQLVPPGLNMIYLPFTDDLREPERDPNFTGSPPFHQATDEQQEAATALLKKLHIKDFAPGSIPNPHLKRHYQVIEALALGEEPPALSDDLDHAVPDIEGMKRHAHSEILAFRNAVYGEGNDGAPKPAARKRKAGDGEDAEPPNFKEMVKQGTLHKLTLPPLREFCKVNRLSTNGRKDEIIQRITEFLEKSQ